MTSIIFIIFILAMGTISSQKILKNNIVETNEKNNFTHTVFLEIATSQNCDSCHYWSENIYNAYISGEYDFEYVEMIIFDHDGRVLNEKASDWEKIYGVGAYPTSILDGDYRRIIGNTPDEFPNKLESCGNRAVSDIFAEMSVLWLGDAKIYVSINIENKENTQYNGYIRACITEIVSRYDTDEGKPYHYSFLDYAFNNEITINAGEIYSDIIIWDGNEHFDNHGDNFGDIYKDNIQITMGVFNNQDGYVDETVSSFVSENVPPNEPNNPAPVNGETNVEINHDLSWDCSDPNGGLIKYDIYFGTENPPQKIASNITGKSYDPGEMVYKNIYYWKVVARDNFGASTSGPIWSFSIKEKSKNYQCPNMRIVKSINGQFQGQDLDNHYSYLFKMDSFKFFKIFLL